MFGSNKNLKFIIVILVLVVLILGEIGFLGYKFWFQKAEPCEELPAALPTSVSLPTAPPVSIKPYIQLIFGWLKEVSAEEVTLRTEDDQLVTYPLVEAEVFGFNAEKEKDLPSLFIFFDPNFEEREAVEPLEVEKINLEAPAYLVVRRTADNLYLGKRLVVVTK